MIIDFSFVLRLSKNKSYFCTRFLALRSPTVELPSSETRRARAHILPVPCPRIIQANRRFSEGYRQRSERRGRPSRRTHRRVDKSLSTCSRPDCGANPSAPETRLLSHGNHLDSPSDRLLPVALPTCAGSWEGTLPHEPTTPCACPTKDCVQRYAHRPGRPTCRRAGPLPVGAKRACPRPPSHSLPLS